MKNKGYNEEIYLFVCCRGEGLVDLRGFQLGKKLLLGFARRVPFSISFQYAFGVSQEEEVKIFHQKLVIYSGQENISQEQMEEIKLYFEQRIKLGSQSNYLKLPDVISKSYESKNQTFRRRIQNLMKYSQLKQKWIPFISQSLQYSLKKDHSNSQVYFQNEEILKIIEQLKNPYRKNQLKKSLKVQLINKCYNGNNRYNLHEDTRNSFYSSPKKRKEGSAKREEKEGEKDEEKKEEEEKKQEGIKKTNSLRNRNNKVLGLSGAKSESLFQNKLNNSRIKLEYQRKHKKYIRNYQKKLRQIKSNRKFIENQDMDSTKKMLYNSNYQLFRINQGGKRKGKKGNSKRKGRKTNRENQIQGSYSQQGRNTMKVRANPNYDSNRLSKKSKNSKYIQQLGQTIFPKIKQNKQKRKQRVGNQNYGRGKTQPKKRQKDKGYNIEMINQATNSKEVQLNNEQSNFIQIEGNLDGKLNGQQVQGIYFIGGYQKSEKNGKQKKYDTHLKGFIKGNGQELQRLDGYFQGDIEQACNENINKKYLKSAIFQGTISGVNTNTKKPVKGDFKGILKQGKIMVNSSPKSKKVVGFYTGKIKGQIVSQQQSKWIQEEHHFEGCIDGQIEYLQKKQNANVEQVRQVQRKGSKKMSKKFLKKSSKNKKQKKQLMKNQGNKAQNSNKSKQQQVKNIDSVGMNDKNTNELILNNLMQNQQDFKGGNVYYGQSDGYNEGKKDNINNFNNWNQANQGQKQQKSYYNEIKKETKQEEKERLLRIMQKQQKLSITNALNERVYYDSGQKMGKGYQRHRCGRFCSFNNQYEVSFSEASFNKYRSFRNQFEIKFDGQRFTNNSNGQSKGKMVSQVQVIDFRVQCIKDGQAKCIQGNKARIIDTGELKYSNGEGQFQRYSLGGKKNTDLQKNNWNGQINYKNNGKQNKGNNQYSQANDKKNVKQNKGDKVNNQSNNIKQNNGNSQYDQVNNQNKNVKQRKGDQVNNQSNNLQQNNGNKQDVLQKGVGFLCLQSSIHNLQNQGVTQKPNNLNTTQLNQNNQQNNALKRSTGQMNDSQVNAQQSGLVNKVNKLSLKQKNDKGQFSNRQGNQEQFQQQNKLNTIIEQDEDNNDYLRSQKSIFQDNKSEFGSGNKTMVFPQKFAKFQENQEEEDNQQKLKELYKKYQPKQEGKFVFIKAKILRKVLNIKGDQKSKVQEFIKEFKINKELVFQDQFCQRQLGKFHKYFKKVNEVVQLKQISDNFPIVFETKFRPNYCVVRDINPFYVFIMKRLCARASNFVQQIFDNVFRPCDMGFYSLWLWKGNWNNLMLDKKLIGHKGLQLKRQIYWQVLLQKALAMFYGGYEIFSRASCQRIIRTITGSPYYVIKIKKDLQKMWKSLNVLMGEKVSRRAKKQQLILIASNDQFSDRPAIEIMQLLDYEQDNETKFIKIMNPKPSIIMLQDLLIYTKISVTVFNPNYYHSFQQFKFSQENQQMGFLLSTHNQKSICYFFFENLDMLDAGLPFHVDVYKQIKMDRFQIIASQSPKGYFRYSLKGKFLFILKRKNQTVTKGSFCCYSSKKVRLRTADKKMKNTLGGYQGSTNSYIAINKQTEYKKNFYVKQQQQIQ